MLKQSYPGLLKNRAAPITPTEELPLTEPLDLLQYRTHTWDGRGSEPH